MDFIKSKVAQPQSLYKALSRHRKGRLINKYISVINNATRQQVTCS